jgi:hypothetical protein
MSFEEARATIQRQGFVDISTDAAQASFVYQEQSSNTVRKMTLGRTPPPENATYIFFDRSGNAKTDPQYQLWARQLTEKYGPPVATHQDHGTAANGPEPVAELTSASYRGLHEIFVRCYECFRLLQRNPVNQDNVRRSVCGSFNPTAHCFSIDDCCISWRLSNLVSVRSR